MRRAMIGVVMAVFVMSVAACGGKSDVKAPANAATKGEGNQPEAKKAEAKAPSVEDVAKMDCDAICKTQTDCNVKAGVGTPPADMLKMCASGCSMVKSVYDPPKHGTTVQALMRYADGKCPQ